MIASIAATGGLLFGFDTGVISGAIPFLQDYFELTDSQVENLTALGLIGAVVGALVTGRITDYLGRKKVILASAFIFATGAVWTGLAPTVTQLMISRFYLGLAIGVSSFAVPLYISEISPTKIRGTLVSMFQLLITVGILTAYLSDNAFADNNNLECWRPMLYVGVIPALILFTGMFFLPETPRWLMSKGREEESRKVLRRIEDPEFIETSIADMKRDIAIDASQAGFREIFKPWLRNALIIAMGIMFFQQFVGINTVIYYSPKIFLAAGFEGAEAAIAASVIVGVVNVFFTIVSLFVIDRLGRRKLYFIGFPEYCGCTGLHGPWFHASGSRQMVPGDLHAGVHCFLCHQSWAAWLVDHHRSIPHQGSWTGFFHRVAFKLGIQYTGGMDILIRWQAPLAMQKMWLFLKEGPVRYLSRLRGQCILDFCSCCTDRTCVGLFLYPGDQGYNT